MARVGIFHWKCEPASLWHIVTKSSQADSVDRQPAVTARHGMFSHVGVGKCDVDVFSSLVGGCPLTACVNPPAFPGSVTMTSAESLSLSSGLSVEPVAVFRSLLSLQLSAVCSREVTLMQRLIRPCCKDSRRSSVKVRWCST